jgi:quercetin dioxygenase-like cupin family protein
MLQIAELHPHPASELPVVDVGVAGDRMRELAPWRVHGHAAATLVREDDLRIVLLELRRGARLQEHKTTARVSVHVLRGRVRLSAGERRVTLTAGQLVVLDPDIAHDVEADVDSALLVTLAWRSGAS